MEVSHVFIETETLNDNLPFHGLGGCILLSPCQDVDNVSIILHLGYTSTSSKRESINMETMKHNLSCNVTGDSTVPHQYQNDVHSPKEEELSFSSSYGS